MVALSMATTVGAACSTPLPPRAAIAAATPRHAVSVLHETWTDTSRPTPAHGSFGGSPSRTLATTILYPRPAPAVSGHPASRGPYPLVVFAPGLGADPDLAPYLALLYHWAAAGFVVAAPTFPGTNAAAPGGQDLPDYVHQPGDMSFVITQVLAASASGSSPLAGLVDPAEIGAAGHSLGGVTTLGLIANTCCRDPRVRAAVVMAGDRITFPTGRTDFDRAPPVLFVHGDADQFIPYSASVTAFNQARPPKGLLTIHGGNHDAPVNPEGPGFASVVRITTEFFDAYLEHDRASIIALGREPASRAVSLIFAADAQVRLPVSPGASGHRSAWVRPDHDLVDGQTVTVRWRGFAASGPVNVLQCSRNPPAHSGNCDLATARLLAGFHASGSTTLVVHTGAVGSGTCEAGHSNCVVVVNQGASRQSAANVVVPITFAG
jgi:dienelactone hydrolase